MTKRNLTIMVLALLGVVAPAVSAQERERTGVFMFQPERRAWLGFSYELTDIRRPGERTLTLNVVSVVDDSPAAQAGLQQGDQILRINNLGASDQLLGSLGSALNPGDTVTLHVRRGSGERDLRIIAAKPPEDYAFGMRVRVDGDSVRQLVRIFTDSMRAGMDTTVFRYLQRGDSAFGHVWMFRDSAVGPMFDRARDLLADTARVRRFRIMGDSIAHGFQFGGDSVFFRGEGQGFAFGFPEGEEFMVRPFMVGMRAVAGAELHALNPELASYFDVQQGVLVTNSAAGSPARRAGLQPGDVITSVNGEAVTTVPQVRRQIDRASGRSVKLEVVRHGRKVTVDLPK